MEIKVLDHGFVKLRNVSGPTRRPDAMFDADDIDPANTARISFNNLDKDRTREDDLKLCNYLMRNWHTSPFEMIDVWLHIKLPFFVFRQLDTHRTAIKSTASTNEISARYTILPEEWYIPEVVGGKAKSNKQGQEDNLPESIQIWFRQQLDYCCSYAYERYQWALERGVAPEHARLLLHVNHYTELVWKQDLHNMMHFLSLRMDSHAQVEAREYANAIYTLLKQVLPESMKLFKEYRSFK